MYKTYRYKLEHSTHTHTQIFIHTHTTVIWLICDEVRVNFLLVFLIFLFDFHVFLNVTTAR